MNTGIISEVGRKPLGAVTLSNVVKLGAQCLRELFNQSRQIVSIGELEMPAGGRCKLFEDLEVLIHLFYHSGSSNFYHYFSSIREDGSMRLAY